MLNGRFCIVELEGGFNCRDIGGHLTIDGHRVRRGRVYRSAALSRLTAHDLTLFATLGIENAIDMRTTVERRHHPSRFAGKIWTRDYDVSSADIVRLLADPSANVAQCQALMIDIYRLLPDEQAEAITVLFRRVTSNQLPVVVHCAVGKDRTGVIVALLLDLVGVPKATILDDYLYTAHVAGRLAADTHTSLQQLGLEGVDEALIAAIVAVDAAYLTAMFDAIQTDYGSTEGYARHRLGITPAQIRAIRNNLLEPGERAGET